MRKLVKIIGAVVAILILALVSIPMFISADYLKGQLVAQVKQATGRDLVIKGNASLTLFPNIAIRVEDVTLGNPAGFATPHFVKIAKLETGAALQPLLNKQLRITGITLEGADVNLEETASGAKNWEFTVQKAKEETKENLKKDAASSSPLNDFSLGDVSLKNSVVTYRKAGATPLVAKDITLDVSGADGKSALKVKGSVNYQNEPVSVKLTVDKLLAALDGKATPVAIDVALPASSFTFKGTGSMKGKPVAEGALGVAISDLPKLMGWATGKPAAAGLPKTINLQGGLNLQGTDAVVLKDMSLAVDALNAKGQLGARLNESVPSIKATLAIPSLDLDAFTKKSSGGAAAKSAPSATTAEGWSNDPIDLSGLRAVNAVLDLTIGALHVANADISDIKTTVDLHGGVLKVNLAQAKLYGGSAKGVVTADGSGAGAGIGSDLTLSAIDIDKLMTALSGASRLKGTANLAVAVNGRGASQRAIVSSLGGKGSMRVNDGAVKGVNIANFIRNLKQGGLLFSQNTTESTDFTELSATFDIAQGVLSNKDLSMKSPVLRLAGSGTVSLPPRSLNYRLVPTLVGTIEGQGGKDASGLAVPLLITGPWSNPSVTPDVKGILEESLKNPEALKQNLKDIKGTIKQLNSPKDLGKALLGGGAQTQPAPATDGAAPAAVQPAAKPSKEELIQQGIGGLLNGLNKK